MIQSLVLQTIEKALNAYLLLDPDTIQSLHQYIGKRVKFRVTDWNIVFILEIHSKGIHLSPENDEPVQATIEGHLVDLGLAGLKGSETTTLFGKDMMITGDVTLAEAIHRLFSQVNIDWEEQLSKVTGDVIAHQLGRGFRAAKDSLQTAKNTLHQNIKEFLQLETHLMPTKDEVEHFIDEVRTLQHDVDRLEARIHQRQTKGSP